MAQGFLIPRAVGYSAGLLNFFFRGKMEISLPDEGVYGVVDHTVEKTIDTSGFRKIRLKVKNITPRGTGIEPMTAPGKLRAVAKFHRNTCYQSDLSGEYGAPGRDWTTCRRKVEPSGPVDLDDSVQEIIVSDEVDVPASVNTASPESLTFVFPTPIPINATDLFLQVVYRGPLGDETDAVAVATKDISEPTYQYFYDVHDQYMYPHYPQVSSSSQPYTWTQWCDQAIAGGSVSSPAECNARLWPAKRAFKFSPTSAAIPGWDPANPTIPPGEWTDFSQQPVLKPVFTLFGPTGSYSRVAYLTDPVPTNAAILVEDWNGPSSHIFYWLGGTFRAAKNQVDRATGTLTPSHTWALARGLYVSPSEAQFIGAPTNVGPLTPKASDVDFPCASCTGGPGGL
ncbi:hypothetical protein EEB15_12965 [Ramlibacter sp. WS9]|nr:hypothetical protein EEB15_12965 [Ramlibacter sp. WS9]